ncbi:antibiotic biosynthesis monooxygenase [Lactobacillus sp. CC-MHH1034]|uniref:putative quinol monooxygenase n=1 Tax=Agrilactobacillus fermenti TaxID=2586909 RepID=UPI001E2CD967|nr:putative quinol monooxygenase [Agrilactobacillus fermenti]MCD2256722.1 antibiotic biosynthesis monooxygenase [Agrilactobacillus fermenti]
MKVINVALKVKPDQLSAYEAFIADLVAGSRAESGNLSYGHYKKLGTDNEYEIIEHWQDEAAVAVHNQTPHFQRFLNEVDQYLVAEPEILRMTL